MGSPTATLEPITRSKNNMDISGKIVHHVSSRTSSNNRYLGESFDNDLVTLRDTIAATYRSVASKVDATIPDPPENRLNFAALRSSHIVLQPKPVRGQGAEPSPAEVLDSIQLNFDDDLMEAWLSTCSQLHGCSVLPKEPISILAIDCVALNLVKIGSQEKYFALSYVWGNAIAPQLTNARLSDLLMPGALRTLGHLSNTIEDAIRFVCTLGQRYLWVDRLCIIQDNATHLTSAITAMHQVYAHASAVIIAGSGEDSNAGLARVPRAGRIDTPFEYMDTMSSETLADTCYETRGWTLTSVSRGSYQERLLSQRRIVFLKDYVLFQCPKMTVRDDVHAHESSKLVNVRFMQKFEAGLSVGDFRSPVNAYRNAVHTFCTRTLRNPNDVLRAFEGVSRFLGELIGSEVVCGLLQSHLLDTLCWKFRESHMTEVGRRHGFPSWSWCGWLSAVTMPSLPVVITSTQNHVKHVKHASVTPSDYKLVIGSILATFSVGQPTRDYSGKTPMFTEFSLLDSEDVFCGSVQLPLVRNDLVGTHQRFVVLKEATRTIVGLNDIGSAAGYNQTHECTTANEIDELLTETQPRAAEYPFFIVLMLDKVRGGRLERAGIGHIYRNALLCSLHHSFEDNLVLD
ncbi:HET-domain-containing protein [Plenodomus tracheiphilus IPT5]|uniref:HET-domain-containing protein n=1 Tax=Plenodomus tracheiphilus IPT5 TaxID=1408161 RepID=A0A6A7ATW7_9PLEO|nr:HET-domain-containing protein [Plenodomus tracheiphilus IPT5]